MVRLGTLAASMLATSAVAALFAASCAQTELASAPGPVAARVVTPEEDAAHPGKAVYDKACGGCHDNPESTRAPGLASLRLMRKAHVEYAITVGYMRTQAKNLTASERQQMMDWLTLGQPDNTAWLAKAKCKGGLARISATAKVSAARTFGLDDGNTRMVTAQQAGFTRADIPKMELAWAVGLPQTPTMRSQPVSRSSA